MKFKETRIVRMPGGFGSVTESITQERVVEVDDSEHYQGNGVQVDDSTPVSEFTEVNK